MNANSILRAKNPIVHCITNYVTVNDVANAILAIGGSPIMSDDLAEVSEVVSKANALVINTGTLNLRTIDSMMQAGFVANQKNIPVILDPVGVGISHLRNATVDKLLTLIKFTAIRGNLSEIAHCAGKNSSVKGVDNNSADNDFSAIDVAKIVADKYHCLAIVTGESDIVCDVNRSAQIKNGVKLMSKVTGTGCMLSGIIGAYLGACEDYFSATVNAVASMGIAGEISFAKFGEVGTGSFHIGIIDALSKIDDNIISKRGKINYAS